MKKIKKIKRKKKKVRKKERDQSGKHFNPCFHYRSVFYSSFFYKKIGTKLKRENYKKEQRNLLVGDLRNQRSGSTCQFDKCSSCCLGLVPAKCQTQNNQKKLERKSKNKVLGLPQIVQGSDNTNVVQQ